MVGGRAGGLPGTLVGIYANNGGCGSRKPADFDYFKYNDFIDMISIINE